MSTQEGLLALTAFQSKLECLLPTHCENWLAVTLDSMKAGKTPWLPVWAQRLQWLSYVSFIPFVALVFIGVWEYPFLAVGVFALFALPIFVRAYFKLHAVARGEITWFFEQNRDLN